MMSNKNNTTLYIGVTSDLIARVYEHKNKIYPNSFTAKYNCDKLVFFKQFFSIEEAIINEKKLKGTNRKKKEQLINEMNPEWKDLSEML